MDTWAYVALSELLRPVGELVELEPEEVYQQITVRMWGNGVVLRGELTGSELGNSRWFVARTGQFIISKIDARHGASGLVPHNLDGAVVSNDFPLFNLNERKLYPPFFQWFSKTPNFIDLCRTASEGTTNRVRLKLERFLSSQIPLPPLEEQQRIVARIDALASRIAEARGLRQGAVEEGEVLLLDNSACVFSVLAEKHPCVQMGRVLAFRNDLIRPLDGVSGKITFVGLQHIESHTGKRIGEDVLLAEELKGRKFCFSPGEILYGYLRPYLNKVWIADCDGFCSVDQYVLRPDLNVIDISYLAYFMRSRMFLQSAIELTNNLQLPRLRSGLLQAVPIPLPSVDEQRSIVTYLDSLQAQVDQLKRLQAESAAELDALLPSILDQAFKGEL